MQYDYDLVVIGAGSGGIAAGRRAASYGAKVAIIEYDRLGGTCVNRGCVPKKLMVYSSRFPDLFEEAQGYGWDIDNKPKHSWEQLIESVNAEVIRLNGIYQTMLDKAGVEILSGFGRFLDNHTVAIVEPSNHNTLREIRAEKILIAVGGKPVRPQIPGIEHTIVSDDIFHLKEQPKKMVVLGGGYIGSEFACVLNAHGTEVTQIIRSESILNGFDGDIRQEVQQAMSNRGVNIINRTTDISIRKQKGLQVHITQENGIEQEIQVDAIALAALGRKPNLRKLGLENTSIKVENAAIAVDEKNRTSVENIFAVGDCTDNPNLTPVAIKEGRIFADTFFGKKENSMSYYAIPTAIFTTPEAATVGMSEEDAQEKYGADNIKIFKSRFRPMYYTLPKKDEKTMMKLVVETSSDRVLGAHMVGDHAGEIIQGIAIPIKMGATKADFDATVAIHPSSAEEFVTM
ncbi:MAG: glutathione-disulfide reductase [Spirochaetota bacterium]